MGDGVRGVDPPRRVLERAAMDVRRKDLDRALAQLVHQIAKNDGKRVRFLARRTSGHPDPERAIGRAPLEESRKDPLFEELEELRVPEEPCDSNQQIAVEHVELTPIPLQALDVLVDIGGTG